MPELQGKEIADFGKRFFEGVPGFAWAAILLNVLLEWAFPDIPRSWIPVCSVSLAWAGEKFGHYADEWLYDPFWEPGGWCSFPAKLGALRAALAESWRVPVTGIFKKAAHLSSGTEIWEKGVKLWLEFSKASRSFMFLSAAALLWFAWPCLLVLSFVLLVLLFVPTAKALTGLKYWFSGASLIGLLLRWRLGSAPYSLLLPLTAMFFVSTGVYLGFRIFHNIRLYEKARNIEPETRDGFFCVGQRVLPVRHVVLCFPDAVCKCTRTAAEGVIQSRALLHVHLRVANGSVPNSKYVCNLNLDDVRREYEKSKRFDWGADRERIRVPPLDSEWAGISPDLLIMFVRAPGVEIDNINRRLNANL